MLYCINELHYDANKMNILETVDIGLSGEYKCFPRLEKVPSVGNAFILYNNNKT